MLNKVGAIDGNVVDRGKDWKPPKPDLVRKSYLATSASSAQVKKTKTAGPIWA